MNAIKRLFTIMLAVPAILGNQSGVCSANFPMNVPMKLSFTPTAGSSVSNWGSCTPLSSTVCSVVPDGNVSFNIGLSQSKFPNVQATSSAVQQGV